MTSSTAAAHSGSAFRRLFGSRQPHTQPPLLHRLLRLSLLLLLVFSAAGLRAAEMYCNPLAGEETLPAGTYGEITVTGDREATSYTQLTKLEGGYGNYGGIFIKMTDRTDNRVKAVTQSVMGWFKGTKPKSGVRFLWTAITDATGDNIGYGAAITHEGYLCVGRINRNGEVYTFDTQSYTSRTTKLFDAEAWHHVAVTLDVGTFTDGRVTMHAYVDGKEVQFGNHVFYADFGYDTSANCNAVYMHVPAAGFYVDDSVMSQSVIKTKAADTSVLSPVAVVRNLTVRENISWANLWGTEKPAPGKNDELHIHVTQSATLDMGDSAVTPGAVVITCDPNAVLTLVNGNSLQPGTFTNNGKLRIEGGTADIPIAVRNDGSTGEYILANAAVVQMTASGNQVYRVTGEAPKEGETATKPELRLVGGNLGTKEGSTFKNVRLVIGSGTFALAPGMTDATVDMAVTGGSLDFVRGTAGTDIVVFADFNVSPEASLTNETQSDVKLQVGTGKIESTIDDKGYKLDLPVPLIVRNNEQKPGFSVRCNSSNGFTVAENSVATMNGTLGGNVSVRQGGKLYIEGTYQIWGGDITIEQGGLLSLNTTNIVLTDLHGAGTVEVINGSVYLPGKLPDHEDKKLDFTGARSSDFKGSFYFGDNAQCMLVVPAGMEKTASVPAGATLVVQLSPQQIEKGYTVNGGNPKLTADELKRVQFRDARGNELTHSDGVYTPTAVYWRYNTKENKARWENAQQEPITRLSENDSVTVVFSENTKLCEFPQDTPYLNIITVVGSGQLTGTVQYGMLRAKEAAIATIPATIFGGLIGKMPMVDIEAGATLTVNGEAEVAAIVFGTGMLKKTGTGTLTLKNVDGRLTCEKVKLAVEQGVLAFKSIRVGEKTLNPTLKDITLAFESGTSLISLPTDEDREKPQPIAVSGSLTIDVAPEASVTYGNKFSGPASLTKTGDGTFAYSLQEGDAYPLHIDGGTLALGCTTLPATDGVGVLQLTQGGEYTLTAEQKHTGGTVANSGVTLKALADSFAATSVTLKDGAALVGPSTLSAALTVKSGATLDASAGALSAASLTLPNGGSIGIRLPADRSYPATALTTGEAVKVPQNLSVNATIGKTSYALGVFTLQSLTSPDNGLALMPTSAALPKPVTDDTTAYSEDTIGKILALTNRKLPASVNFATPGYTNGTANKATAAGVSNALDLFTNVASATADGSAVTVDYAFGISGITVKKVEGTNYVVLSANVTSAFGTAAGYADGTSLEVLANGTPLTEAATPCDADGNTDNPATGPVRFFRVPYTEATGTTRYTVRAVRK